MKKIKTFHILFLVMLLSLSCAPKKHISKTDIKTDIQTQAVIDQRMDDVRKEEKKQQTDENLSAIISIEEIERKTTAWEYELSRYDTSLPVDSLTGTPPVKEVIKMRSKENKETDYKSGTEITYSRKELLDYVNSMTLFYREEINILKDENIQLVDELKSIPTSTWWKWLLVGIFCGIVLSIAFRYYFKG